MRTAPILFKAIRRMTAVAALATLVPTLAWAADAPVPTPDKGDMAWMLTSTALVLLMSVPALGLFYGGLVRTKNMLSVLMQVFVGFSLITVLWCVYGYSLAFTAGNEFIGGLSRLFLTGTFNPATGAFSAIGTFDKGVVLNELVYVGFQATFAAITCCLILGSLVERIKFSAILLFLAFWFTFCYCPVAHMVWYVPGLDLNPADHPVGGLLASWGALDFAGGTVVHINSGVAGLVGAMILGKRIGLGKEPMPPHSLTMTMIGASLLWFGWFGFNAGSALEANGSAALAFMNTYLATACAVLTWMGTEWLIKGKPSMLGAASGAVAGLVAITPAAGNGGIRDRARCRSGMLLGRHGSQENDPYRRCAGCVRRARPRRHLRRADHRHLQRPGPRRTGWQRLSGHLGTTAHPGQGGGRGDRLDCRGGHHRLLPGQVHPRPARQRGRGTRRPGHHRPRRARLRHVIARSAHEMILEPRAAQAVRGLFL
jgi:ammonium transporter